MGCQGALPGWQLCRGISGSIRVEWVAGFVWNQWQAWSGIRKHLGFPATTVYPAGDHPGHLARGFADKNDVDQPNCCGSCVRYSFRCGSTKIALSLNSMVRN